MAWRGGRCRRAECGNIERASCSSRSACSLPRRAGGNADTPARVLRTLTFVAVGQQHHKPAGLAPLLLRCGDELVDDDLGAVREIAELRFHNVSVWGSETL